MRWIAQHIKFPRIMFTVGTIVLFALMLFEVSIFPLANRSAHIADIFTSDLWEENPEAVIGSI